MIALYLWIHCSASLCVSCKCDPCNSIHVRTQPWPLAKTGNGDHQHEHDVVVSTDVSGDPDLQFLVSLDLGCKSIHCMLHGPQTSGNKGDKAGRYGRLWRTVMRNGVHQGQHKLWLYNRSRSSSEVFELGADLYVKAYVATSR